MFELLRREVVHSNQQGRRGMTYGLIGRSERWKKSEGDQARYMADMNEVMEVGWIGSPESSICGDSDFETDVLMDRQPVQLLQAVRT